MADLSLRVEYKLSLDGREMRIVTKALEFLKDDETMSDEDRELATRLFELFIRLKKSKAESYAKQIREEA